MSPNRALPPPALAIQRWLLFVAALGLALVLILVYQWGYDRGTKTEALDFARRSECRTEFSTWVQEARDHVTNGQGTISQGTYRGLKTLVSKDEAALRRALRLGDIGDKEIADWNDVLLTRQAEYRALTKLQRTDTTKASHICDRGPPH